jgi:NitT/TauT family transport system ATP-binding protein
MIRLVDVTVRLGGVLVLDALSLDLPDGSVTALTGPNGSGKTTTTRVLLGLAKPQAGRVEGLDGLRRAAAFQEPRLCEHLSAVANVRLVLPRSTGAATTRTGLEAVGLPRELWEQPVSALSGGQRRRVALVRALAPEADLVVLDEPYAGLDADARDLALAWTSQRLAGRVGVLVTHDPSEAVALGATVVTLERPDQDR